MIDVMTEVKKNVWPTLKKYIMWYCETTQKKIIEVK